MSVKKNEGFGSSGAYYQYMRQIFLKSLIICSILVLPLGTGMAAGNASELVRLPQPHRFNLDFPGGSAQELIATISAASGNPVNAFIPEDADQFTMPPLKYYNITVTDVLASLRYRDRVFNDKGSYDVGYEWSFRNNIWVLNVETVPDFPPQDLVSYKVKPFSVASLMEVYTIDAITTTIDSAWKLNGASEQNEIMFHPETKILLVKCSHEDMTVMEEVLKTLESTFDRTIEAPQQVRITILGDVNKPGNYVISKGSGLIDALAEAGGETRTANIRVITLKNSEGTTTVNLKEIISGHIEDIELQSGTTIYVPERII
ncbi:MAG: SLBB domain-containing protein [Verrucomicrobiota bacterium]